MVFDNIMKFRSWVDNIETRRCSDTPSAPGMVKKTISKTGRKSVWEPQCVFVNKHRVRETSSNILALNFVGLFLI